MALSDDERPVTATAPGADGAGTADRTEGAPPRRFADPGKPAFARIVMPSGDGAVAVTRHADVRMVMSDPRFKTDLSYEGAPRMLPGENIRDNPDDLINMDPPRHTRLRRLVSKEFSPRRIAEWRPRVTEITRELLDGLTAEPPPVDFVAAFALPLPVRVICELLGVPEEDFERFHAWSDAWLSTTGLPPEQRGAAMAEFRDYVIGFVEQRRAKPGDALIDQLVAAQDEGDTLTEKELVLLTLGLIVGGHDTTASFLSKGLLLFLTHPDQYERLAADPGCVPGAVEEVLRYDAPSDNGLLRVATEDVELTSGTVREGEGVLPIMSAANMDAAAFPDPHRFDIARTENQHVSFGHGRHLCLGSHLARLQLQIAFAAIAERLPTLRLAVPPDEIRWKSGMLISGPATLPVTW